MWVEEGLPTKDVMLNHKADYGSYSQENIETLTMMRSICCYEKFLYPCATAKAKATRGPG